MTALINVDGTTNSREKMATTSLAKMTNRIISIFAVAPKEARGLGPML
jgi:hypothetical protein